MTKTTKITLWCAGIFIIFIFIPIFTYLSISVKKLHNQEIENIITAKGGIVVKVNKINPDLSPFGKNANGNNIIYKIIYEINGINHVAWYRGLNIVNDIHGERTQVGYGEEWIFE